ncbi:MAG: trypsin-like peptidase domain-containing protein [Planctomycetota bacterium]
MTSTRRLFFAAAFVGLHVAAAPAQNAGPAAAAAPSPPPVDIAVALQERLEQIAEELYPSVVAVTAFVRDPAADEPETEEGRAAWVLRFGSPDYPGFRRIGSASGIAMTDDGYVLTCRHPLFQANGAPADLIDVETEDQKHTISALVGAEPTLNLAVLRLEVFQRDFPPGFRPARLGDSDTAKPGHFAIGVGDPFGPERYFGVGTITSMPERECYQELLSATYIQAALRVHPETYGGPLVNIHGDVIGILLPRQVNYGHLALQDSYGIEYALPSNIFRGLFASIRDVGSVRSPWLGFAVMSRAELRQERGAEAYNAMAKPRFGILLENTFEPSPASVAGLEPGDFLVKFNGQIVYTPIDFQRFLYLAGIGKEVELELFRNGETLTKTLTIEERPPHATQR